MTAHALGATYRLQLTPSFGFDAAREVVEYLAMLGVTDVYSSPVFAAVSGSVHGYDVVDHGRLNPELGSADDFRRLSDALKDRHLGLLLDWVPNHMGIGARENEAWQDILENGPSALQAAMFDIDWDRLRGQPNTVLLPVLGGQYGAVLERGELRVVLTDGWFRLTYFDRSFPLAPSTLLPLLADVARRTGLGADDEAQQELLSLVVALEHLPGRSEILEGPRQERAREKEVIKRRFARLVAERSAVLKAVEAVLMDLNGKVDVPTSFDALDALLRGQSYRLASWRVASEEINYRRFFDVNDLAAIRMEDPVVFARAHAALFRLMDEGRVDALRLDHTDGLYDPQGYFGKLQARFRGDVTAPTPSPDDAVRPIPILIEKILGATERLRETWPIDGTTGYEIGASLLGLWVDPAAEEPLTSTYRDFTGEALPYAAIVYECKLRTLEALASEVDMLARRLARIAAENRSSRDFTLSALTRALRETLAAFPIYRTYVREGEPVSDEDARIIKTVVRAARLRSATLDPSVFAFLEQVLLARATASEPEHAAMLDFTMRFQQLSGPVMAKAIEDTAFYRYNRLLSLNEVGGDAARFGTSIERFHAQGRERARRWPRSMSTLSTHDSKRGEDASARIAVLSEIPAEWRQTVARWSRKTEPHKKPLSDAGAAAPSRRDEYTFYQALVGAWPFGWDGKDGRAELRGRVSAFLQKAAREAKVETSWTRPDEAYEEGLRAFVESALSDDGFVADVAQWSARIDVAGATNGLAQTVLKICVPGVPDTFQGAELWHQSFVDPDNRRPVDFGLRRKLLAEIMARAEDPSALSRDLLARWKDGALKLYLTHVALRTRARLADLFRRGTYEAIDGGEHVVAFARTLGERRVVVVAPRLTMSLVDAARPWAIGDVWRGATLEVRPGAYRDAFTGRHHRADPTLRLADVLAELPVALLVDE